MNIMIIGSGGREHALAWKSAQSPQVDTVYVVPGNAGTATENKVKNVALNPMDFAALTDFAKQNAITLTIIGPEAPLVAGIVDYFTEQGLPCFGPTQGAAQLEGSKAFSKDFLQRHNIPTAAYQNFTDAQQAISYLKNQSMPIVIKADGLAAGKGVIIAQSLEEAVKTVEDMLSGNSFGEAGHRVVIEEFMQGEEASFIALVDGRTALPFASSQDHKARDNGDLGPNTGGMGAYSPAPVVTPEIHARIMQEVIMPTVKGMAAEGNTYVGFLYAGLMIDAEGQPKVVEFNCRFGDPEAQPVMMRLLLTRVRLWVLYWPRVVIPLPIEKAWRLKDWILNRTQTRKYSMPARPKKPVKLSPMVAGYSVPRPWETPSLQHRRPLTHWSNRLAGKMYTTGQILHTGL